ncbi:unnamed protein product [Brassica rapa]|uniref:Exocyst complex component SEC5 n=1 Tax=Brassica campestris TaxID=3711 RepID=A0A8D9DA02_BRACM|nr:unnamed protein product [Brassica rapa]
MITQLEYFETILRPYLTVDATESLKSVKGAVLEKVLESIIETVKNNPGGHQWKPTRGSEDAILNDKQSYVSPDDLLFIILIDRILYKHQYSNEMLQFELEKTRLNNACFVETSPLDSISPVAKFAYSSSRAYMDSPVRTRPRRK